MQHQHHRRRKKEPHTMRTVELLRSRSGYGFTISGQQPCVLSCIVGGSPADCAGLKTGDYLMVVNGLNVSNASHDDVVRLVGSSLESLTLEIAENYNSSDSSEDELQSQLRPKSKYQNQRGRRIQGRKEQRYDTSDPAVVMERRNRFGGLHPEVKDPRRGEDFRSWQRFEPTERSLASGAAPLKYRGQQQRPKHTIITRERRLGIPKTSRQCADGDGGGPRIATASITSLRSSQDAFVPVHATSHTTLRHRHAMNGLQLEAIRAMVGYVGSIEMPALARPPSWRTQSLKGAVRRLRIEQKMHTSVLMRVSGDGVHLVNASGQTIAQYPADNIVSCGVCPDDKRFFGLMTLHRSEDDTAQSALLGSSCHVFSIDPQLNRHSTHIQKARSFNVKCSINATTHCCAEFPASATAILRTISRLCCNHDDGLDDADIAQMELSDDPTNRYLNSSSASDSGLECVGKAALGNKVYVVEMPIETNSSKSETTTSKSSLPSTKYSCSNAKNAVRVSLATNTCAAENENSDVFSGCSDTHRGGSYAQRPDSGVQLHSKRSRPTEAQRNHVQLAVQKALSATRHPVDTASVKPRGVDSDTTRVKPRDTGYQNVSMPPPPPLPARQPRGRNTTDALSVATRKPLATMNTPHSHSTSRIAQLSRPKSTPPIPANDRWEGLTDVADYESDPCDSFTAGRSDASVVSTTLPRARRSRQFAADTNYINEQLFASSSKQSAATENSNAEHAQQCRRPPVGCAASWAVNFDNLLSDSNGLAAFTDFLKKEFSEENIKFWNRCEQYKEVGDEGERLRMAQDIFSCHLATSSPDAVNVDSFASQETKRRLQSASPELFEAPQRQIYQLMKQDSYARFLKSDQYKSCIMAAMEGKVAPFSSEDKADDRKKIKKSKSTTAAEEGGDERRRRSLLPWVRNKTEKRLSRIATDSDLQKFIDGNGNNGTEGATGRGSVDLADFSEMCHQLKAATQVTSKELFCRVSLPDETTTVICPVPGQNLLTSLVKMCERRKLCLTQYDVLYNNSDKLVDLTKDVSSLGCLEMRLVRRVVFRLDLAGRSLGVKATPGRPLRDVLRPILLRYGLKPNGVVVYLWNNGNIINQEASALTVDNQRLLIRSSQDPSKWTGGATQTSNAMKPPVGRGRLDSDSGKSTAGLVWQATHRQLFKDVTRTGSVTLQFDDTGVWDPDKKPDKKPEVPVKNHGLFGLIRKNSMGEKDGKVTKGKMKPPQPLGGTVRPPIKGSRLDAEDERFLELLSRVQGRQLDDQRGLKPHDLQMPDFLKPQRTAADEAPARDSIVSAYCLGAFHPPVEGSDDIQGRHSCLGLMDVNTGESKSSAAPLQWDQSFSQDGIMPAQGKVPSSVAPLQWVDQSFSQDGILPAHDEASDYFTRPNDSIGLIVPDFSNTSRGGDVGRSIDLENRLSSGSLQIYVRSRVTDRARDTTEDATSKVLPRRCLRDIVTRQNASELCVNDTDDFKCQARSREAQVTEDDMDTDSIPECTAHDTDSIPECTAHDMDDRFVPLFSEAELTDTDVMEVELSTPSPTTHDIILVSEESSPEAASPRETSDVALPTTTVSILKKWVADRTTDGDGKEKMKKNLAFAECEANGDIQVSFV